MHWKCLHSKYVAYIFSIQDSISCSNLAQIRVLCQIVISNCRVTMNVHRNTKYHHCSTKHSISTSQEVFLALLINANCPLYSYLYILNFLFIYLFILKDNEICIIFLTLPPRINDTEGYDIYVEDSSYNAIFIKVWLKNKCYFISYKVSDVSVK